MLALIEMLYQAALHDQADKQHDRNRNQNGYGDRVFYDHRTGITPPEF